MNSGGYIYLTLAAMLSAAFSYGLGVRLGGTPGCKCSTSQDIGVYACISLILNQYSLDVSSYQLQPSANLCKH
jgi:hypothetical protein